MLKGSFSSESVNFSLKNDQFRWDNVDLGLIRPQIDLEIDNKNRFPVKPNYGRMSGFPIILNKLEST